MPDEGNETELSKQPKDVTLTTISLSEQAQSLGGVEDLSERDRAKLSLARYVLSGIFLLVLVAMFIQIGAPDDKVDAAKGIFDFVKSIGPPIVTLVIGFYFRGGDSE